MSLLMVPAVGFEKPNESKELSDPLERVVGSLKQAILSQTQTHSETPSLRSPRSLCVGNQAKWSIIIRFEKVHYHSVCSRISIAR
jgi:hypothetical protein